MDIITTLKTEFIPMDIKTGKDEIINIIGKQGICSCCGEVVIMPKYDLENFENAVNAMRTRDKCV
jgi:hypothetical protein